MEILRQIIGRHGRIDESVLDLDRHIVLAVHDHGVEDLRAHRHLQRIGQFRAAIFGLAQGDDGGVDGAALGNLVGNVAHAQKWRAALGGRHERALTLDSQDNAFGRQFAQRPVGGHPADAQCLDQFVFRRHPVIGRPVAGIDPRLDPGLQLFIQRQVAQPVRPCGGRGGRLDRHGDIGHRGCLSGVHGGGCMFFDHTVLRRFGKWVILHIQLVWPHGGG